MAQLEPLTAPVDSDPPVPASVRGPVLFFDGGCGLCDRSVRFAFAHDAAGQLHAAPLGGETATRLLAEHAALLEGVDSVVWYDAQAVPAVRTHADAALAVLTMLGGGWRLLATIGRLVPRPLRDLAYRQVAAVRYRVFGRADACPVWPAAWRARILP